MGIDFGYGVTLDTINWTNLEVMRCARNSPEIWKWCRQHDLISPEAQRAWFERIQHDPTISMYAIWDHGRGLNVGVTGLTSIDKHNRKAEFSIYIFPDHQHRAYARNGLKTLIHHGFNNLNINRIWGETFVGNERGINVYNALGFAKEGTLKSSYFKDGKYIDSEIWSIRACDWVNGREPKYIPVRDYTWREERC